MIAPSPTPAPESRPKKLQMTTLDNHPQESGRRPPAPPRADLRILKRLVRRILPARAHSELRRVAHTRRLNRLPAMAVDAAPLPKASEISFPDIFPGDSLADGWQKAKTSISEVFQYAPPTHAADPESCRAIYHLIRHFQPRSLLEIGTNRGASTIHAAMSMREYRNPAPPPRLVTVDLFDVNNPATAGAKRYRISTPPAEMLARLDCADLVEFAIARSTDYLSGRETQFDFIILDHAPAADLAYRDIALAIKALRPRGQLLLHSYFPGKKPLGPHERVNYDSYLAVRRLQQQGAPLVALPLSPLPWPTETGAPNLTSLALLARE